MNIVKRVLVVLAALALGLSTGCSGNGEKTADPAKPGPAATQGTDPSSALDKAFSAKLKDNGWQVSMFGTVCVETQQYAGWTAVCATELSVNADTCVQPWLIAATDEPAITKFKLMAKGKPFGPLNPSAGSIDPPACTDE